MAADPSLIPLTQARRRIHAAAMKLFAEQRRDQGQHQRAGRGGRHGARHDLQPRARRGPAVRGRGGQAGARDDRARGRRLRRHRRPGAAAGHRRAPVHSPCARGAAVGPLHEPLRAQPGGDAGADVQRGADRLRDRRGLRPLPHRAAPRSPAMVALLAGGTLAAMLPVLDGHGTWREIGSDTAELLLAALGVDRDEAQRAGALGAAAVGCRRSILRASRPIRRLLRSVLRSPGPDNCRI